MNQGAIKLIIEYQCVIGCKPERNFMNDLTLGFNYKNVDLPIAAIFAGQS